MRAVADIDLVRHHTVYSCVMGSRAFGLETASSDTDRRGVFVAPTPSFWRFEKPPTHVTGPAAEQFSWEFEHFCRLALQSNPNVLECLYSPLIEYADATGRELLSLRGAFLSRQTYGTFTGYSLSQCKKVKADIRHHGAPRWKHVVHLLRLLLSCRDLLRTGELVVDVGEKREWLLSVRRGEVPWRHLEQVMTRLINETEAALAGSPLPEHPDRARVEDFLSRVRRASAGEA